MDKWYVYAKKADFKGISERFGIDQVTARILRNRDIVTDEEIDYFLNAGLDDLYDERLIPDLEKAAAIIYEAIVSEKSIRIIGDYDIDGVCATYILMSGLSAAGARVDHRIPDRINDGYGININLIREAAKDGIDLIVTCDNGIAAVDEIRAGRELGIDIVVTDHHNVRKDDAGKDILPEALAVADVKRSDSRYPTEEICGAVTAWKLIKLIYELAGTGKEEWLKYIEFAALATVGDIMELKGENRVIVKEGLKRMSSGSRNIGLKVLIDELGLTGKDINTYHVGFVIGPCINAGGRLETAESALKLFMTEDEGEAEILAGHLKYLNEERKAMTEKGAKEGIAMVSDNMQDDRVLVVYIPELHESLAGIVAGRIKEHFNKPCFVITRAKEGLKGSGRSIEAYDMFSALCKADEYLLKYGGHKMAAGLSLKEEMLDKFRIFLNEHSGLKEEDLIKKIWIDVPAPISYMSGKLIEEIEGLKPFGNGFERPLFADRGLIISDMRVLGSSRNTLKMRLKSSSGAILEGIIFGEADSIREELFHYRAVDILYSPEINSFRGTETIQINIKGYRETRT